MCGLKSGVVLRFLLPALAAIALLPTSVSAAELNCPLASTELVAEAVGMPLQGGILPDPFNPNRPLNTGANDTVCLWNAQDGSTVVVAQRLKAFTTGGASDPADLAVRSGRVPAEARALIANGEVQTPTFEMLDAEGLGDRAVWLYSTDPSLVGLPSGGYIVQRGADAILFGFQGVNEQAIRGSVTSLAEAVLTSE